MQIMARISALVMLLAICLAGSNPQLAWAQTVFEAASTLGLNLFSVFLNYSPEVGDMVSSSSFKGIVCAPSSVAMAAVADLAATIDRTSVLNGIKYHVMPNATLTKLGVKATAFDGGNITVLENPGGGYVFFSTFSYAAVATECERYNNGEAQLCKVDSIFYVPVTNIYLYLSSNADLSTLKTLVEADPVVFTLLNNNDTVATLFAPTNDAFKSAFKAWNKSAAEIVGTMFAQKILLTHFSASLPLTSTDAPRSLATPALNVVLEANPGKGVSVQGSNKTVPIIASDGDAGKSVVHKISGLLSVNSTLADLVTKPAASGPSSVPTDVPPSSTPTVPSAPPSVSSTVSERGTTTTSQGPAGSTPPTAETSSDKGQDSRGIIIGSVLGGVLALIVGGLLFFMRKRGVFAARSNHSATQVDKQPAMLTQLSKYASGVENVRGEHVDLSVDQTSTTVINVAVDGGKTIVSSTANTSNTPTLVTDGLGDDQSNMMPPGIYRVGPDGKRTLLTVEEKVVIGLPRGDPFLQGTAHQYSWTAYKPGPSTYLVEAGITDVELNSYGVSKAAAQPSSSASLPSSRPDCSATSQTNNACSDSVTPGAAVPPPTAHRVCNTIYELSCQEVQDEIELLDDGLIGRGATALVFKCRWPKRFGPDALLAIKVLKSHFGEHAIERISFAYESKLLASARHPNVVRMYGYCLESPTVCIILELLPGALKDRLYTKIAPGQSPQESPPLTILEVLQLSADMSAGLAHLHSRDVPVLEDEEAESQLTHLTAVRTSPRIVHRDLKPGNILISSQGRAKITDFGLARQQDGTTLHTDHIGAGTTRYMAPELLMRRCVQGTEQVLKPTNRVDIFSLAVVMYECLSRKMVWQQMSDAQVMTQVVAGQRPPIPSNAGGANAGAQDALAVDSLASNGNSSTELNAVTAPATFQNMPEIVSIIEKCWQQQDLQRPTALEVHEMISALLAQCTARYPSGA